MTGVYPPCRARGSCVFYWTDLWYAKKTPHMDAVIRSVVLNGAVRPGGGSFTPPYFMVLNVTVTISCPLLAAVTWYEPPTELTIIRKQPWPRHRDRIGSQTQPRPIPETRVSRQVPVLSEPDHPSKEGSFRNSFEFGSFITSIFWWSIFKGCFAIEIFFVQQSKCTIWSNTGTMNPK